MKAYLRSNDVLLAPFKRFPGEIRFHRCTVKDRLREQLQDAGFEVVSVERWNHSDYPPGSLLVQDDLLLSNGFIKALLAAIPDPRLNYQLEIDVSRFPIGYLKQAPSKFEKLPLYYQGTNENTDYQPLIMSPKSVFDLQQGDQGVPGQVGDLSDLCMSFPEHYALQIRYWFDLHTATGLYCRERIGVLIKRARRWLPDSMIRYLATKKMFGSGSNVVGKNCKIHPTAVLENCIIGDNVQIGPFAYVRASVVSDNVMLRDHCSILISYIGESAYISDSTVYNSHIGAQSYISPPNLSNVIFGERSFIGGGSGFGDFKAGTGSIPVRIGEQDLDSELLFLGSCVGDDVFIGANMAFAPGRTIPSGSRFVDYGAITDVPQEPEGTYVLSGNKLIQIPDSFIGAR